MSKRAKSQKAGSARAAPTHSTPHRPVVFLALVLFLPAVLLVLGGNLSVQTALLRFIGALLVSWVAARLVLDTVRSYTGPDAPATSGTGKSPADMAGAEGLVERRGVPAADLSTASLDAHGTGGPDSAVGLHGDGG